MHKSDNPEKKYYVELEGSSGRRKRVYFGAAGMNDYTTFPALEREERKNRYIQRHRANEDWSASGIETAGFWAKHILWNQPTISESLRDTKIRFRL